MPSFHVATTKMLSSPKRRLSGIVGVATGSHGVHRQRQHANGLRKIDRLPVSLFAKRMLSTLPNNQQKQLVEPKTWAYQFQRQDRPQHRTMMARSSVHNDSEDPSQDPEAKAMTFLVGTLGHDKDVAKGVLDALKQSGVSGGPALLAMVRSLAGRWEVDEDAGLEALVESVTVELARSKGKKTVSVWVLPANAWASREGDDQSEIKDDFKRAFKVEGFEDMVRKQLHLIVVQRLAWCRSNFCKKKYKSQGLRNTTMLLFTHQAFLFYRSDVINHSP